MAVGAVGEGMVQLFIRLTAIGVFSRARLRDSNRLFFSSLSISPSLADRPNAKSRLIPCSVSDIVTRVAHGLHRLKDDLGLRLSHPPPRLHWPVKVDRYK